MNVVKTCTFSENEKNRRWDEIKLRQHRLMATSGMEQMPPAHIDHIMKSGFSINDIKGMNRYGEEAMETDDRMLRGPSRPPRNGSLSRISPNFEMDSFDTSDRMKRSTSAMDMDAMGYGIDRSRERSEEKKKRGRSPFKLFSKKRDKSKDKFKSKTPEYADRRVTICTYRCYFSILVH